MRGKRGSKRVAFLPAFAAILLALLSLTSLQAAPALGTSPAYTPHGPIAINGNQDFTQASGVTGGGGMATSPYIIEGWEIDATGTNGISIRNTDSYFVLRNVFVHSGGNGLYFANTLHGRVENSTLTGNTFGINSYSAADLTISGNDIFDNGQGGITLWSSSGITITENWVYRDWVGIVLYSATTATLVGNNISLNKEHGVFLADTTGAVLSRNTFTSDGLLIRGTRLEQFESHTITSDNLVNGKPLLFFKDQNGLILDSIEAGQLVVVNSQAVQVRRVNLTASGAAIELGFVQQASVQEVLVLASFTSTVTGGLAPYAYAWSFGDGTTGTDANPHHSYTRAGSYLAKLTVTDALGTKASQAITFTVVDPLVATVRTDRTEGTGSVTVHLTSGVTGGTAPYTYRWDFGDGTGGDEANPAHTFQPGSYTVTLTVTDSGVNPDALSSTTWLSVTVQQTQGLGRTATSPSPLTTSAELALAVVLALVVGGYLMFRMKRRRPKSILPTTEHQP